MSHINILISIVLFALFTMIIPCFIFIFIYNKYEKVVIERIEFSKRQYGLTYFDVEHYFNIKIVIDWELFLMPLYNFIYFMDIIKRFKSMNESASMIAFYNNQFYYELGTIIDFDSINDSYKHKAKIIDDNIIDNPNVELINSFFKMKELLEASNSQKRKDFNGAKELELEELNLKERFIDHGLSILGHNDTDIAIETQEIISKLKSSIK